VSERKEGMMIRDTERGVSKLKVVIWLLIISGLIFVGVKVIPIYFSNYQLQDKMRDVALYSQTNRETPEKVHDEIYKEAQELELPIRPEQIIVAIGSQGMHISADYTATVDLIVYQLNLHLTASGGHQ
jgi:hypothetical protein